MFYKKHSKYGFTLVELSIVILIIGILVAGVTGGAKLIEQAELRGVISDMKYYEVSVRTFRLQYDAIPGDFKNASAHFSGCTTTNTFCGGNGDGRITYALGNVSLGVGVGDESVRVFRHMFLAGIIGEAGTLLPPANYDTYASWTQTGYFPKSKISGSAYMIATSGLNPSGVADNIVCHNGTAFLHPWTIADGVTAIYIGGVTETGVIANSCKGGIIPSKAYQIDRKIDDASDASGAITGATTGIVRAINGAGGTCLAGAGYDVTVAGSTCIMGLKIL